MKKLAKILLFLALMLAGARGAKAQGALYHDIAWRYTPAGAFPAGGATITICTSTATGTPCAPTVTVYADSSLSSPVANPLPQCTTSPQTGCMDNLGNFSFYIPSGTYTYTVTGQGLTPYGPIPLQAGLSTGIPVRLQTIGGNLVSGDFGFSGWGTGATLGSISGSDSSFTFTVTAGTSPSIDPTVTLTFHDGPWTAINSVSSVMIGGSGNFSDIQNTGPANTTAMTMTYMDLPVATKTYTISVVVVGRSTVTLSSSIINPVIQNPSGPQTITGFPLNLPGGLSVSGSAALFNAGITGTGNTGTLNLGSGALGTPHSWTATQTFPANSIGVSQLTACGTNGQGPVTIGGVMTCSSPGFSVTVNGGGTTSPLNFGNSPAAQAGNLLGAWQYSAGNASVQVPISGNGTTLCSVTGSLTNGHTIRADANGNCIDGGGDILASSTTLMSGDVAVSATTVTDLITKVQVMPSSGCPCRVKVNWSAGATTSNSGGVEYWIFGTDGVTPSTFATGGTNTTGSVGPPTQFHAASGGDSTVTWANGASVTFKLRVESEQAITVRQSSQFSAQGSFLNITVFSSN